MQIISTVNEVSIFKIAVLTLRVKKILYFSSSSSYVHIHVTPLKTYFTLKAYFKLKFVFHMRFDRNNRDCIIEILHDDWVHLISIVTNIDSSWQSIKNNCIQLTVVLSERIQQWQSTVRVS
jgi:hypothetical protein